MKRAVGRAPPKVVPRRESEDDGDEEDDDSDVEKVLKVLKNPRVQKVLKKILSKAVVQEQSDGVFVQELRSSPTLFKACSDLFWKIGVWSVQDKKVANQTILRGLEELLAEPYVCQEFAEEERRRLVQEEEFRSEIAQGILLSFASKGRRAFAGEKKVQSAIDYAAIGRAVQLGDFKHFAAIDIAYSDIFALWISASGDAAAKKAWEDKAAAAERLTSDRELSVAFWKDFFAALHQRAPLQDSEGARNALITAYYRTDARTCLTKLLPDLRLHAEYAKVRDQYDVPVAEQEGQQLSESQE